LILLLRHAAQAVEMWWRGAAVDFVESAIASDFILHRFSSCHQQMEVDCQVSHL